MRYKRGGVKTAKDMEGMGRRVLFPFFFSSSFRRRIAHSDLCLRTGLTPSTGDLIDKRSRMISLEDAGAQSSRLAKHLERGQLGYEA